MNGWQYLLLVNIYLVLFYGFYTLLLRRETFFQLNRIYLVSAAALSFIIPVMQADWVKNLFITKEVSYGIYGAPVVVSRLAPVQNVPINIGQILAYVYFAVVLFLIIRLVWQLVSLNKIIKNDQQDVAYSFFKKIRLPKEVAANHIISAHEEIHAKQWHSADVFIIEAVMIINWFNPVVYFYRRGIKHIHEFIADDHALKIATNKADYAMLLLTQTFNAPAHNLVNTFLNHSLLKQRIIMLQKNKSQRIKLLKYGLSAPLFMLMLVLSSATVNNSKAVKAINLNLTRVMLLPPPPISSVTKMSVFSAMSKPDTITKNHELTVEKFADKKLTDTVPKDNSTVFAAVEKEPGFPGGPGAFAGFLAKNIKYPAAMRDSDVQGKVIVTFVVEKDGSLSGIRALRGPSDDANQEAVRVVSMSPKWSPGSQRGKAVRVQYTIPILFSLADAKPFTVVSADSSKKTTTETFTSVKTDPNKTQLTIGFSSAPAPLYIVNGKEINVSLAKIDPDNIESITVLKNNDATLQYGSKAKNGVIVITLKGYKAPAVMPAPAKTNKSTPAY